MQVAVFIAQDAELPNGQLLVLPTKAKATTTIAKGWRFYGSLDSRSTLFRGVAIELHLQAKGFVLVKPRELGVWS